MLKPRRYRHTPFGAVVVGALAASALVLAGLGLAFRDPVFLHGGPVMMGIAALLFHNLTVEAENPLSRPRGGGGVKITAQRFRGLIAGPVARRYSSHCNAPLG